MDILEKLNKIKQLIDRGGTPGEKSAARNLFDQLVNKYQISPEELEEVQVKVYTWECKNKTEEELLIQILSKVIKNQHMDLIIKDELKFGLELTYLQYVEVDLLFELYNVELENEIKYLKQAFYKKHDLFPPITEDQKKNAPKISEDQVRDILKYFRSLKDIDVFKQIGE